MHVFRCIRLFIAQKGSRVLAEFCFCSRWFNRAWQAKSLTDFKEPLDAGTLDGLKALSKQLINAENRHDLAAVKRLIWDSPSTLFVAKTATASEGNWAGFWGTDVVMRHFHDLYQGTFKMEPDYEKERIVGLTADVAEIYLPVKISVAYAGQTPCPSLF